MSSTTDKASLRKAFEKYGEIEKVFTQESYGAVTFKSKDDAKKAQQAMNGATYDPQPYKQSLIITAM